MRPSTESLPDISSMKLSELKMELKLYGVDSSVFCEKQEFTSALDNARKTLPRPTTTYHEVEPPQPSEEEIQREKEKAERASKTSRKHSSGSGHGSGSSSRRTSSSASSTPASSKPAPTIPTPSPAAPTPAASASNATNMKKIVAARSPMTALQQIKEHPSEKLIGERNHSFLPGSPFSFSLKGSLHEADSAVIRIPDGVMLTITTASVERKTMEAFLVQKGSIGVSLRISTEENPQLLPIWTFDQERSKSYTVTDLGVVVCGPRTVRLLAYMEMGFHSRASVDVNVFGSVSLDTNKF